MACIPPGVALEEVLLFGECPEAFNGFLYTKKDVSK